MVILVVFKVFLAVKNLEILIQILLERPIYCYYNHMPLTDPSKYTVHSKQPKNPSI